MLYWTNKPKLTQNNNVIHYRPKHRPFQLNKIIDIRHTHSQTYPPSQRTLWVLRRVPNAAVLSGKGETRSNWWNAVPGYITFVKLPYFLAIICMLPCSASHLFIGKYQEINGSSQSNLNSGFWLTWKVWVGVVISVRLASWLSACGKNFNVVIFSDTLIMINVKLCMTVGPIELSPALSLSVTLIVFQGHSSVTES